MGREDFDGAKIRIQKEGPEDYIVYVDEFLYGSSTSIGADSMVEGMNAALRWLDVDITVSVG